MQEVVLPHTRNFTVAKTDTVIITQTYHPTVLFVKMSTNF